MAKKRYKIEDIPLNELNEWGYPKSDLWEFAGFTKGAARYHDRAIKFWAGGEGIAVGFKEDEKNDE